MRTASGWVTIQCTEIALLEGRIISDAADTASARNSVDGEIKVRDILRTSSRGRNLDGGYSINLQLLHAIISYREGNREGHHGGNVSHWSQHKSFVARGVRTPRKVSSGSIPEIRIRRIRGVLNSQ